MEPKLAWVMAPNVVRLKTVRVPAIVRQPLQMMHWHWLGKIVNLSHHPFAAHLPSHTSAIIMASAQRRQPAVTALMVLLALCAR